MTVTINFQLEAISEHEYMISHLNIFLRADSSISWSLELPKYVKTIIKTNEITTPQIPSHITAFFTWMLYFLAILYSVINIRAKISCDMKINELPNKGLD